MIIDSDQEETDTRACLVSLYPNDDLLYLVIFITYLLYQSVDQLLNFHQRTQLSRVYTRTR